MVHYVLRKITYITSNIEQKYKCLCPFCHNHHEQKASKENIRLTEVLKVRRVTVQKASWTSNVVQFVYNYHSKSRFMSDLMHCRAFLGKKPAVLLTGSSGRVTTMNMELYSQVSCMLVSRCRYRAWFLFRCSLRLSLWSVPVAWSLLETSGLM